MKLLSFLLKYSKGLVALAILGGVINGLCNIALLAVIRSALSDENTAALVRGFIGLCIVVLITKIISEISLSYLGQKAIFDLRMQLTRGVMGLPLGDLEKLGSHRMLAALTEDVMAIVNAIASVPMLCINGAIVVGCLVYLGWLSGAVLGAVLGFLVLGIVGYQLPVLKAARLFRAGRELQDKLFGHFRALTEGAKELKLHRHRSEVFVSDVVKTTAGDIKRNLTTGMSLFTVAAAWGQLLLFLIIGLLLFAMPQMMAIDGSTLIGYTLALLYIMTPLQVLMNALPQIKRAGVAIDKLERLKITLAEHRGDESRNAAAPVAPVAEWKSFDLVDVTYTYHDLEEESAFVLGPINLSLHAGELVFLVGGNGSGKTTLIKIISGLYNPEGGEMYLDGKRIDDDNREAFRQNFSVVFSDFYLFDSLLGIGAGEVDERALEYLKRLQLENKVKVAGGALSTTKLSQGQRKRLALLTAYLEDRPVYIFDEWAADQDPAFKEIFYFQILPELKARGKTVLVISHDDRYYQVADRIVKLDYGKLIFEKQLHYTEPVTDAVLKTDLESDRLGAAR
ncbi:MAG TPA: cyclic peptide export ABC transporter [Pyrinomonadaceae bacterium]|nr:cyclic peptide export ABC transporter [Pyrinomonadaceae bacterium]